MNGNGREQIAHILGVGPQVCVDIEAYLSEKTGKKRVLENLYEENRKRMHEKFGELGVDAHDGYEVIASALLEKIRKDAQQVEAVFSGRPLGKMLCEYAYTPTTFVLKEEAFARLILKNPPAQVMQVLGYSDAGTMLERENIYEIGAALRFVEGSTWLNEIFFKEYEALTPNDFEERAVQVIELGARWEEAVRTFVQKKYHNVSHLKELGVIFILPADMTYEGHRMRTVLLVLHYLNEVVFYGKLFARVAKQEGFSQNIISLLRGDVLENKEAVRPNEWLIVQRYLAKENKEDWRLTSARINPEALHWRKAERMFAGLKQVDPALVSLSFWGDCSWLGDYFKKQDATQELLSLNVIDQSMSLVKEREGLKYVYHHQEALWNAIFSAFFGEHRLEEALEENILAGKIAL